MTIRFTVLLGTLLVVLPAGAQDQFDEATGGLQLEAIVRDRGRRLEALEDAVSVIAGNQMAARALAHCHDWQPECEPLLEKR